MRDIGAPSPGLTSETMQDLDLEDVGEPVDLLVEPRPASKKPVEETRVLIVDFGHNEPVQRHLAKRLGI